MLLILGSTKVWFNFQKHFFDNFLISHKSLTFQVLSQHLLGFICVYWCVIPFFPVQTLIWINDRYHLSINIHDLEFRLYFPIIKLDKYHSTSKNSYIHWKPYTQQAYQQQFMFILNYTWYSTWHMYEASWYRERDTTQHMKVYSKNYWHFHCMSEH